MYLLIDLLILCLIAGLVYWILTLIPLPPPFKNVAIAIFLIIIVIILISMMFGGLPLPRPVFR